MATQSVELEEAITNYFVAQYNEMHQKEIAEEEVKSKLALKQPLPEAQADKIEQVQTVASKESASAAPEEEKKAEDGANEAEVDKAAPAQPENNQAEGGANNNDNNAREENKI